MISFNPEVRKKEFDKSKNAPPDSGTLTVHKLSLVISRDVSNRQLASKALSPDQMFFKLSEIVGADVLTFSTDPLLLRFKNVLQDSLGKFSQIMHLSTIFGPIEDQLKTQIEGQLVQAKVGSYTELQAKRKSIHEMRERAYDQFLASKEHIELLKQADLAMVRASTLGEISPKDQKTVESFWEIIQTNGSEIYHTVEKRMVRDFFDAILNLNESVQKEVPDKFQSKKRIQFVKKFKCEFMGTFNDKLQQLRSERDNALSDIQRVISEYLIVLAKLQGHTLYQAYLRDFISNLANEHKSYVEHMRDRWCKKTLEDNIAFAEKQLQNTRYIDYAAKLHAQNADPEIIQHIEENDAKDKKLYRKQLEENKKNLENLHAYACSILGDPALLEAEIPPDTDFEVAMRKHLGFSTFKEFNSNVEEEMYMDLSALSVDYFVEKQKKKVQAKLELFSAQADRITIIE